MRKHKKKVYAILIGGFLICSVSATINYYYKNHPKHILIKSLYDSIEYKETFDKELLKRFNEKNLQKLEKNKKLSAEDYFFIAYEYRNNDDKMSESIKYITLSKEKNNPFTNKFIQLYNDYLLDYYYTYIQKDDNVFDKINKDFNNITIKDWNKYTYLLNSKLGLLIHFDGGTDSIISKIENMLQNEEQLTPQVIAVLKDMLAITYQQKGYHARVLEIALETKALINRFDIKYEDAYMVRALINEANVYTMLNDTNKAEIILKGALEIPIENQVLQRDIKVTILDRLAYIYLANDRLDKVPNLFNTYKEFTDDNNSYNSDVLYYFSLVRYHVSKYEKDKSSKEDLDKAERYLKEIDNCFSGNIGARNVNVDIYKIIYSVYLEYLKGNVQYVLDKYNDLLNDLTDRSLKLYVLEKMCDLYVEEGKYKEASECYIQISNMKIEESLLINDDYSIFSIKKYENELEIRKISKEKMTNYIKWFSIVSILGTITMIVIIKNNSLRKNNITDSLTKINNRLYFNEMYNKKLKKNHIFSICMLDIDNFKKINDTYGHLIGDKVLKKVAEIGKRVVGNKGYIFRYGGEEFVIILNLKNKELIANIAEEIRNEVERLTWDSDLKITISMGIADSAIEKEKVLEVADSRLYISKNTGKNKITLGN